MKQHSRSTPSPDESTILVGLRINSWIKILIGALLGANVLVFLVFQATKSGESIWAQVIAYLESDAFKVITISLLLPILLFLLESVFKVRKAMEERNQRERERRKERQEKEQDRRKERQWKCIESTAEMWDELYSLASEVTYHFEDKGAGERVQAVLRNLNNLISRGETIINMWSFRFPNLTADDLDLFLYPMNMLLKSAITVGYSLAQDTTEASEVDRRELKDALGAIQSSLLGIAHHNILSILKLSMDAEDPYIPADRKQRSAEGVKQRLRDLKTAVQRLRRVEAPFGIFPALGKEADEFREACERFQHWVRERWQQKVEEKSKAQGKPQETDEDNGETVVTLEEMMEYADSKGLFERIGGRLLHADKIPYSPRLVKHLAHYLIKAQELWDLALQALNPE